MEIDKWLTNIQDWFLPRLCPACGGGTGPGRDLCGGCERVLPGIANACPRCAAPFEYGSIQGECGQCQRRPPPYVRGVALYHYAPPIDHFIRTLKFHDGIGLARLLGRRLASRLQLEPGRPDRIMPVPLHPTRLRSRGYNQALELARPIAAALDIPLDYRSLRRVRATAAQSNLTLDERQRNVRGAFAVDGDARLAGLRIALVDDVLTTGSTVAAASLALLAAGVREIEVWVAARA